MPYMEENLDLPLKSVLNVIQQRVLSQTRYFGIKTLQSPTDFWIYQEILHAQRPDVIVEIGNFHGGSALALAHICDALGNGRLICLDINHDNIDPLVREHPRIQLITGDACSLFDQVRALIKDGEKVLVIEDSSHTYENTLNVLRTYSCLTPVGGYFIVEDSICHHGLDVGPVPGPYEAIEAFTKEDNRFEVDRSQEGFCITWNPKGYLLRVR